jgi:hypothetical protein
MRNKKISISISIFLTIVIFSIFILHQRSNTNNGELESFGVNENNIIAKISNDNTVDIFTRDGSNLLFYIFEVSSKNKISEEKIFIRAKYLFDYNARKRVESTEKPDSVDFVKDDIEITHAVYRGNNTHLSRKPYYGVSISPRIKKFKINNIPVNRVIEYTYKEKVFYIWYFDDLEINPQNIDVSW